MRAAPCGGWHAEHRVSDLPSFAWLAPCCCCLPRWWRPVPRGGIYPREPQQHGLGTRCSRGGGCPRAHARPPTSLRTLPHAHSPRHLHALLAHELKSGECFTGFCGCPALLREVQRLDWRLRRGACEAGVAHAVHAGRGTGLFLVMQHNLSPASLHALSFLQLWAQLGGLQHHFFVVFCMQISKSSFKHSLGQSIISFQCFSREVCFWSVSLGAGTP